MSETKYSIHNGLLTAKEEVSSTRFPRTQTYSGSIFTLERREENVTISKNIWTLSRHILSKLKAKKGREERGKNKSESTCKIGHKKNSYLLPPCGAVKTIK